MTLCHHSLLLALFCLSAQLVSGYQAETPIAMDPPNINWAKGYSFESESHPHAGVQTSDGGFLMVGDGQVDTFFDYYYNATVDASVKRHIFVVKTAANGNLEWKKTLGYCGYNYGKFGIQLEDDTFLIATATCEGDALKRGFFRLDQQGNTIMKQTFPNAGADQGLLDGFMGVSLTTENHTVIATGFTAGYPGYPDQVCHAPFNVYHSSH